MLHILLLLSFAVASCSKEATPVEETIITGDGNENYNLNKSLLLSLVNDVRQKGCNCGGTYMPPVPAVSWNNQLARAAFAHSSDMNKKNYFSHTAPDGSNPGKRIQAAGYQWKAYGENIAHNYPDEQAVVAGWIKSPNHCKTIMGSHFKEMGAGRAGPYWTQDFGTR
jgi:uncharacterized protein YkwD